MDRLRLVRDCYAAYESGDPAALERNLSDDFTFYSPYDAGIDRATYFERCWPNADLIESYEFVDVLTFDGDRISRVEVYFGWDL